jgi:hypothetical protein
MATDAPTRRWAGEEGELAERRRETVADMRLYVEIGLTPVTCRECGVEVFVKKNSHKHTSVQWAPNGVASCPEITAARAADPHALVLGCSRLQASIEDAVRAGQVVVPDA